MRIQKFRTIVTHDLGNAFTSPRGLLFLIFFGIFWVWVLWKLSEGHANWLADPDGNWIASLFLNFETAQILFQERSPTLSSFFLIALFTAPFFTVLAASDQVAGDIGSKQLRYLVTRCQRSELYFGRFAGTAILVCSSYAIVAVFATLIAMNVDNSASDALAYGIFIAIMLPLYVLPIIALMSIFSASVGSMGLSLLIGMSVYFVLTIGTGVLGLRFESVSSILAYLLPNSLKQATITAEPPTMLLPIIGFMLYTSIYLVIGWLVFKKRDI